MTVLSFPATGVPPELRQVMQDPIKRRRLVLIVGEWRGSFGVSACWARPMSLDVGAWWSGGDRYDDLGEALQEAARLSALLGGVNIEVSLLCHAAADPGAAP